MLHQPVSEVRHVICCFPVVLHVYSEDYDLGIDNGQPRCVAAYFIQSGIYALLIVSYILRRTALP